MLEGAWGSSTASAFLRERGKAWIDIIKHQSFVKIPTYLPTKFLPVRCAMQRQSGGGKQGSHRPPQLGSASFHSRQAQGKMQVRLFL